MADLPDNIADRIAELHAQGYGRNRIAAELGCSAGTVTKYAQARGLTFNRAHTAEAVAAHQADAAATRAQTLADLYRALGDQTRRIVNADQWETVLRGSEGREVVDRPGFIPARDLQAAANGIASLAKTIGTLEARDKPGAAAAASLLTSLAASLGIDDSPPPQ